VRDPKAIARCLRDIAFFLDLKGESPCRIRAYEQAARTIEARAGELAARIEGGALTALDGIGPRIERVVTELWFGDRTTYLDTLRDEVPDGVVALAAIRGIGPRRAMALYRMLDITRREELLDACEQHRVRGLRGFGPATEARLHDAVGSWFASRSPRPSEVPRDDPQLRLPLSDEAHARGG